jgi:hypothetical protein
MVRLFCIKQSKPKKGMDQLKRATSEFLESLLEQEDLKQIARDLNQLCLEKGIVGFHDTKAIRIEIERNGLQPSSGDARRREFLDRYGHSFTDAQVRGTLTFSGTVNIFWDGYYCSSTTNQR